MSGADVTTVMVTAAGSAPAVAVIQALREQHELPVRVVAADMDPLSAGFYLADAHILIPGARDPEFAERVLEAAVQSGAQVVFPIIDEELQPLADAAPAFEARGVDVVTNPAEVVRLAKDKWLTFQWCRERAILVPQTWLATAPPRELTFPVMVKPRSGRGSAGVEKVHGQQELQFQLQRVGDRLVQEYIDGPEFTVDILADAAGRVASAVPRERLVTKAGMCFKGRTVKRPGLLELAVQIAEALPLTPRGNLQFKQSSRHGDYYLIEVNPKFGAGLPLTTAAGVNMPLLILKMLRGEAIPPMLGQFRDNLVMLRHWAEVFRPAGELCPTAAPE